MARLIALLFILMVGCNTADSSKDYDVNFKNHMNNHGILLKADSLLFPDEAAAEAVLIPGQIGLSQELVFDNDSDERIYVKRLNYTDYQYRIESSKLKEKGRITLLPTFYLGAEFRGENEDLIVATFYPNDESEKCLEELGIGSCSISDGAGSTFITVKLKSDCSLLGNSVFRIPLSCDN